MKYSEISKLAKKNKMNLNDLAGKIGMSHSGLYLAIKNRTMKIDTLEKIADIFDVPVSYFFGKDNKKEAGKLPKPEPNKPQLVGFDENLYDRISEAADNVGFALIKLSYAYDTYFNQKHTVKELKEFVESREPDKFLLLKYVKQQDISIKGFDTEKLIELNIIDMPDCSDLLQLRKELKNLMQHRDFKLQHFINDLEDYIEDNDINATKFEDEISVFCEVYAKTPAAIYMLNALKLICFGLNRLSLADIVVMPAQLPQNIRKALDFVKYSRKQNGIRFEYYPSVKYFKRYKRKTSDTNLHDQLQTQLDDLLKGESICTLSELRLNS